MFGARIGEGVIIKPSVNIKYPWLLEIGDHSWIGERAWLDCTSPLTIGKHVVISQGVFLCCGMHDWQDPGMGSVIAPIIDRGRRMDRVVRLNRRQRHGGQ